jgi:hypothetical protein
MSVRIVQCLCPSRHCIMAIAYLPGVTAAAWDSTNDITLTEDNAPGYVRDRIVGPALRSRLINPWCSICSAKSGTWCYEDAPTKFKTIEEAEPHLRKVEEANAATRRMFERGGAN